MPLAPLNMISTLHLSVHEMILCTSLFNNRAYHEQAVSLSRTEIIAFLCFRIVLLIVNIILTHFVHESSNVWYSYYQTHGYLIIFLISKHILWQNYFTNHKQSLSNAQRAFNFFFTNPKIHGRYMDRRVKLLSIFFGLPEKLQRWFNIAAWLFVVWYYILCFSPKNRT